MRPTSDVRPRWIRWADPNRRGWLVVLALMWFAVSLALELVAIAEYGWRSAPLDHPWHIVVWLMFAWSIPFATWAVLERKAR